LRCGENGKKSRKSADKKNHEDENRGSRLQNVSGRCYVIRMDQPYSALRDACSIQYGARKIRRRLVRRHWLTIGELYGVRSLRILDAEILQAPMRWQTIMRAPVE